VKESGREDRPLWLSPQLAPGALARPVHATAASRGRQGGAANQGWPRPATQGREREDGGWRCWL